MKQDFLVALEDFLDLAMPTVSIPTYIKLLYTLVVSGCPLLSSVQFKRSSSSLLSQGTLKVLVIFAGIDPGSGSYAVAFTDELGRVVAYREFPTSLVEKDAFRIVGEIARRKPALVALPSGHGLPLLRTRELGEKEVFLLSLAEPGRGPLREFLYASRVLQGITLPSVKELESVPEERKRNVIDMGTADKVASAFFYRTMFESFVLVEAGTKFVSLILVLKGKVVDGIGGTSFPGSAGDLDGEIAYLLSRFSRLTKLALYSGGNYGRALEVAEMISHYYSEKYGVPVIISGRRKWEVNFGLKLDFRFKEASVGASLIASAVSGWAHRELVDMLKSSGTALDYVEVEGWEEVLSWIRTRFGT
jgi:Predicted butyrate kinase